MVKFDKKKNPAAVQSGGIGEAGVPGVFALRMGEGFLASTNGHALLAISAALDDDTRADACYPAEAIESARKDCAGILRMNGKAELPDGRTFPVIERHPPDAAAIVRELGKPVAVVHFDAALLWQIVKGLGAEQIALTIYNKDGSGPMMVRALPHQLNKKAAQRDASFGLLMPIEGGKVE